MTTTAVRTGYCPTNAELDSLSRAIRRLAQSFARGQGRAGEDDLYQIGMEASHRVIPSYVPGGKATLITFCVHRARGAMLNACETDERALAMARAIHRGTHALSSALRESTVDEVLEEDPPARRHRLDEAKNAYAAAGAMGLLAQPETPEEQIILAEESALLRERVEAALAKLDVVDRTLVRECTMADRSLAEVARIIELDYEQARYRFVKALAELGRTLRECLR
ncbi:MAG: sigma-70 family RNA polymerase sigma factor [Polyangiaceae bacterium]|nr:sigma-70 family RNA polymerase sigma factor [Polyangiaceae bacterium]